MAGMFIDPAESFSRALNQGLSTFKSYRDEARLDQDRAFQKNLALAAENRAVDMHGMAKTTFANQEEDRKYDIEKLRPLRLKTAEQGVELGGLQVEGQKTQNKAGEINLQYLPREKEMGLKRDQASINSSNASASANYAQAGAIRNRDRREQSEFDDARAARDFVSMYQTGNYANAGNLTGTRFDPLKMVGAITQAPTLGVYLQNPMTLGGADDKTQRVALQFANTAIGQKDSQRFGFKQGTASIVDLQPGAKGFVGARVVGVDDKTGRVKTTFMQFKADKLFDRANVQARTFQMIARDPNARKVAVEAVKQAHPEVYKQLMGNPSQAVAFEISALGEELKKQRASRNPDMARIQQIGDEIRKLESGDKNAVENALFQNMGAVGQRIAQPAPLAAFNAVRDRKPNLNDDQVASEIDGFLRNAMKNPQNYQAVLSKAGLKPRRNAQGQIVMNEADVLRALSYF